jgi:hypothetical protein
MPRNPITGEDQEVDEPEETASIAVDEHDDPGEETPGEVDTPPEGPYAVEPPPVPAETLSTLELLLDEMVEESDAWGYVNAILDRDTPTSMRHQFYQRWIAMVAERAMSERDMLISRGRQVFTGVGAETMRHDIQELIGHNINQTEHTPFVMSDDFLAEMIYTPQGLRYLVYKNDGTHEIQETVQIGETNYVLPLVASLVGRKPSLLLPNAIEEYENVAMLQADIRSFIVKYVQLEKQDDVDLAAFYVHYSWVADRIPVAPYLHAVGDFEAGKSRLLDVIGHVVKRGLLSSGSLTSAVLFRALDLANATIIVDEADFDKNDPAWKEILKVLLTGSSDRRPVLRTNMDAKGVIQSFDPFGPKVLSTRKPFPDPALSSRCLDFTMKPGPVRDDIPYILPPSFYDEAQTLRNKLLLWRLRTVRSITYDPYARFDGLTPRTTQAAIALLAIDVDDEALRNKILGRLREKSRSVQDIRSESFEGEIAAALITSLERSKGPVLYMRIVDEMQAANGGRNGIYKELNSKQLDPILRGVFDLKTKKTGDGKAVVVNEDQEASLRATYNIKRKGSARVKREAVK